MGTRDMLDSTGVWRWLAAFLAGIVIAGAPTMGLLLTLPSHAEYDQLESQLDNTEMRLTKLEVIVDRNTGLIQELREKVGGTG